MIQSEAKKFIENVMAVFERGRNPTELEQFYWPDVVGHTQGETFGLEDIKNRLAYLNERYPRRKFFIRDVVAFDTAIVTQVTQTFFDEKLNQPCHTELTGIYQMRDNKVKQLWIMTDLEINYFLSADQPGSLEVITAELKNKRQFLTFMETYRYYYDDEPVELTTREIESLYYFLNGYSAKEAAEMMHVSNRTFEGYIATVKSKYHCNTRAELRDRIFPKPQAKKVHQKP